MGVGGCGEGCYERAACSENGVGRLSSGLRGIGRLVGLAQYCLGQRALQSASSDNRQGQDFRNDVVPSPFEERRQLGGEDPPRARQGTGTVETPHQFF